MTNTGPVVLAYETDPSHPGLHRLLRSLEKWKWQHNVILEPRWQGFGRRLKSIAAACRDLLGRYTYCIHVDARDVVAVGPPSEWVPPPVPLLLATEMACWPNYPGLQEKYPPNLTPSPWKHAHSQFTIKTDRVDLLACDGISDVKDDQFHCHELFLSGNPEVALDFDGKYVQSIAHSHPWQQFFEVDGDRVYNKITKVKPLFVHGNGGTDLSWVPGGLTK